MKVYQLELLQGLGRFLNSKLFQEWWLSVPAEFFSEKGYIYKVLQMIDSSVNNVVQLNLKNREDVQMLIPVWGQA